MRLEYIFFAIFLFAVGIGFGLEPYVIERKQKGSDLEVAFYDFTISQYGQEGFESLISGHRGEKYPHRLLVEQAYAVDVDNNEVQAQHAKLVDQDLYLDEDVIITTPDGAVMYSQHVLYNIKQQYFESLSAYEAHYGEHRFFGQRMWYQDGVMESEDVRAIILQDDG
ncbi:MAG: hypothetical protein ACQESH_04505 [Campylobacterota bacterium]